MKVYITYKLKEKRTANKYSAITDDDFRVRYIDRREAEYIGDNFIFNLKKSKPQETINNKKIKC